MGDVLWIEPILRVLASKYDRVIIYTKHPNLFENFPFSNVTFKSQLSFFEKVLIRLEKLAGINWLSVDLDNAYERKPELHFLNAYQHRANLPLTREYPKLYLSPEETITKPFAEPYIVLHIETLSDKKFRHVYGIKWEQVTSFLQEKGFRVVQVGIGKEHVNGTIPMKTSVRELISVIYHAAYFIGIDSGPSHIAASLGIPSLLIFGAIDPSLRHFPELFNGILLKQACKNDCTTFDATTDIAHHCSALLTNGIPRCCVFNTGFVILEIDNLIKKNAHKIH